MSVGSILFNSETICRQKTVSLGWLNSTKITSRLMARHAAAFDRKSSSQKKGYNGWKLRLSHQFPLLICIWIPRKKSLSFRIYFINLFSSRYCGFETSVIKSEAVIIPVELLKANFKANSAVHCSLQAYRDRLKPSVFWKCMKSMGLWV